MSRQFEDLRASALFCPRCQAAQPVRERLLLVLPRAEIHDYRCTVCGTSVGTRETRQPVPPPPRGLAPPAPARTPAALRDPARRRTARP